VDPETRGCFESSSGRRGAVVTDNLPVADLQRKAIDCAITAQSHAAQAIEGAIACGDALVQLKAELPHGEFTPWVNENMPVSLKQCQRYMKVYDNRGLIEKRPGVVFEDLTIKGALNYIKQATKPAPVEATPAPPPKSRRKEPSLEEILAKLRSAEKRKPLDGVIDIRGAFLKQEAAAILKMSKGWLAKDRNDMIKAFTAYAEYEEKCIESKVLAGIPEAIKQKEAELATREGGLLAREDGLRDGVIFSPPRGNELHKKDIKLIQQALHPDREASAEVKNKAMALFNKAYATK